jgi:hypothetical protein
MKLFVTIYINKNWFSHSKVESWGGGGEIHIYEQHGDPTFQYLFLKIREIG